VDPAPYLKDSKSLYEPINPGNACQHVAVSSSGETETEGEGLFLVDSSPPSVGKSHLARPKSSDAVYVKIAAALRDRIRKGDLKPGDKFPSEAAVSAEFGVARGTAREALKKLEADGLVGTLPAVVPQSAASSSHRRCGSRSAVTGFMPSASGGGSAWTVPLGLWRR
jgi:hypothetical protein